MFEKKNVVRPVMRTGNSKEYLAGSEVGDEFIAPIDKTIPQKAQQTWKSLNRLREAEVR